LPLFSNITTELFLKNNTRRMTIKNALGSKDNTLSEVTWPVESNRLLQKFLCAATSVCRTCLKHSAFQAAPAKINHKPTGRGNGLAMKRSHRGRLCDVQHSSLGVHRRPSGISILLAPDGSKVDVTTV